MKPVSGSAIALLTANEVMTQVAWFALAPRLPEIAGNDTLAMVVSSTCMNDARASPIVASARLGGRKPGMFAAVVGESAIAAGQLSRARLACTISRISASASESCFAYAAVASPGLPGAGGG